MEEVREASSSSIAWVRRVWEASSFTAALVRMVRVPVLGRGFWIPEGEEGELAMREPEVERAGEAVFERVLVWRGEDGLVIGVPAAERVGETNLKRVPAGRGEDGLATAVPGTEP